MTFAEASTEYKQQREQERIKLSRYLASYLSENEATRESLRVVSGGRSGKGLAKYTSGRRIAEYDLSNWKWVEVTDDGDFDCIVSLNMPDVDPRSGNAHFLFDCVGLLVSYGIEGYYYETAICTNIDLPLGDTQREEIAQLVIAQFKSFIEKQKEA